jgi:dihydrodipicolinate synthase/N-acetylneuraminate lyase
MNLDGIIVPLITPLQPDESLDEPGLERLVSHVIAGGVSGIFVLGSSGEGPALPDETQERMVAAVSVLAKGKVPVLVGAFAVSTRQTLRKAEQLLRNGGDVLVLVAPYYFAQTQDEIVAHLQAIAREQSVPVMAYNIPQTVKTILEPETVAHLADEANIVAIKDSLGDMTRFQRLLAIRQRRPNFAVYQGAEGVVAMSIVRGANGGVLGLANVAPRLCADLYSAARSGDLLRAWTLQERLMVLWKLHTHGQWLPCLKAAASVLGLCAPTAVAPFEPLSASVVATIRHDMELAGVLPQA